ncbi:MAG: DUF4286 family protein [Muribaculaceae bacterium]|nr:DUF4286 family protein [Muribaculaceae bacterium]
MTLLNTTFHVHKSVDALFIKWVKEIYLPVAMDSGLFKNPLFTRIMTQVDTEATSYAVQLQASSHSDAEAWHDSTAAQLKDALAREVGERVLHFTTYMEIMS